MNSGITRGGLARNSQIQDVPELLEKKQKKGEKNPKFWIFFFLFLPLHPLDLKSHGKKKNKEKKKKKSWNFCGFKTEFSGLRNFWDWGVLGFFWVCFHSCCTAKKKLKKERKIEKNKE